MARSAAWRLRPLGVALLAAASASARAETVVLPTFNVVATTPLGGGEIDVAKVPGAVWQAGAEDIRTYYDLTVTQTLARQAPGVTVNNVSGNDFQPDVSYRGFDASPVSGTPIGLAVYQNGVRINETFGDTVNWDLIPENAIDKMTIVAGDPIYGLNALGGALNVTMKNGFTWQGFEADLRGGSFYRAQEEVQYGKQIGDWSIYMAGTQINDGGWRIDSASQLTNFYGDLGYRANAFELHLQLTAGSTQFGAAAFTPTQELQNDWSSVYTVPQTTYNKMAMLAWTGSYAYSNTLSFQGGLYFRAFNQAHVDGNPTDVSPCAPFSCLNGNPVHDTLGGIIADISQNGTLDLGEIDRNWTQSRTVGGSAQAVDTDKIYGHDNTFTVGASLDYGWTRFQRRQPDRHVLQRQQHVVPHHRLPLHYRRAGQLLEPGHGPYDQPLHRPLRARHIQRHRPPDPDRRRAVQFRRNQSRGRERRPPQRLLDILPSQSDGRPHLQDHPRHQFLCGLCDVQSGADAARARLRRS